MIEAAFGHHGVERVVYFNSSPTFTHFRPAVFEPSGSIALSSPPCNPSLPPPRSCAIACICPWIGLVAGSVGCSALGLQSEVRVMPSRVGFASIGSSPFAASARSMSVVTPLQSRETSAGFRPSSSLPFCRHELHVDCGQSARPEGSSVNRLPSIPTANRESTVSLTRLFVLVTRFGIVRHVSRTPQPVSFPCVSCRWPLQ